MQWDKHHLSWKIKVHSKTGHVVWKGRIPAGPLPAAVMYYGMVFVKRTGVRDIFRDPYDAHYDELGPALEIPDGQ